MVGRLPYERMPTRKIFAVTQKKTRIVAIDTEIATRMCQTGGSLTSVRTNMVIGAKIGESENATANGASGLSTIGIIRIQGMSMISMIGPMNCCASRSVLQAA